MNKRAFKIVGIVALCLIVLVVFLVAIINEYVKSVGKSKLLSVDAASQLSDVDCIVVLGCQVRADGSLSDMLHDRLSRGVEVFNAGASPKILMSGDHGTVSYDEVNAMKRYAIEQGVPSEDVFMDHAGFQPMKPSIEQRKFFKRRKL